MRAPREQRVKALPSMWPLLALRHDAFFAYPWNSHGLFLRCGFLCFRGPLCESLLTTLTEGDGSLVDPFVHPEHAHRAILVAMAVTRVSGHLSSFPPFHACLAHIFLPPRLISAPRMTHWPCPPARTCWAWGSPRWDARTPCQMTATCSSRPTPALALPPWATGSLHITSPSQVHTPLSWDKSRVLQ